MLPNVIIAGTQKAGTTSLFRYLSDHYYVCPSSIKEVDFFIKYQKKIDSKALEIYRSYFTRCSSSTPLRLEASPRYLKLSSLVAKKMHDYLPNVKLIFILREPISVLISYLKWKSTSSKKPLEIHHITSFIKKVNFKSTNNLEIKNIAGRIYAGCYADKLRNFLNYYSKGLIGVFFYDDLLENTNNFMNNICNFLEIDGSFYNNYQFNIENKTRSYKYPSLHQTTSKIYLKFEIFFNQYPFMRRQLRFLYHLICETTGENYKLTDIDKKALKQFYESHNHDLYKLLKEEFPQLRLPRWLKG
jgi:hypothetical protein